MDNAVESSASFHVFLLVGPPMAVVTIDDDEDDDLGTNICMHEESKHAKMENARFSRRYARLRIKLASYGGRAREECQTSVQLSTAERSTVNFCMR